MFAYKSPFLSLSRINPRSTVDRAHEKWRAHGASHLTFNQSVPTDFISHLEDWTSVLEKCYKHFFPFILETRVEPFKKNKQNQKKRCIVYSQFSLYLLRPRALVSAQDAGPCTWTPLAHKKSRQCCRLRRRPLRSSECHGPAVPPVINESGIKVLIYLFRYLLRSLL